MSLHDGYQGEMDDVEGLSESTLDRLLAGRAPADEDGLGLSRFAQDLRAAFVEAPAPAVAEQHLAAMVADAARLHNNPTQPSASPALLAGLAALLPTLRRKVVLSGFFGSLTAKILAGTVAAAAATGGLAAGNHLPAPAQSAVAEVGSLVGLDFPMPDIAEVAEAIQTAMAREQAEKATELLDALAKQVSEAATQPHEVGLPVAQAALECASQVSAIAEDLAASAATLTDPTQALSLAQRATAIAQEAVGCALPKPATAPAGTGDVIASTGGAAPIVEAVTECLAGLKPSIMQLAEGALRSMDPSAAMALASKAAELAGTAGACAGNVGTAAQTAFAIPVPVSIPVPQMPAMPKLPIPMPFTPPAPAAPAPDPATAQPASPAPTPAIPSWWDAVPYMGGGSTTNPAAPWMGMTGQWGNVGQWMPTGPWMPF
ncbi:MAG: hypothetical protein ACRDJO_05685 [Actinomycetota bacterium]